jgi:hypothetical protein
MLRNCDNRLYVFGREIDDLERFKMSARNSETGEVFSLEKMIPPPVNEDENWYYENWGTRYEIRNSELHFDGHEMLCYELRSCETSPVKGIKNIALQYPKLYFYLEGSAIMNENDGGIIFKGKYNAYWCCEHPHLLDIIKSCLFNKVGNTDTSFGAFLQNIFKTIDENVWVI